MAAPVIQFKRGVLTNLPALRAGEPGFTTDSYDLYVGVNSTTEGNQFVGSGRYWTVNGTSTGSGVNLVEGTNNGTSFITLKAPDSLSGIVTYTMPGSDGSNGHILTTDGNGALSFSAPAASDFTIAGDSGSDTFSTGGTLTFTGGEGIDTAITNDTVTITAEDASSANKGVASFDATDFTVTSGDVTLNAERVQDIAGAMFSSNTETLITATYQDADGTIDLVVDNDLSNYDNTSSAFITASSTDTLTNKTFDANGTGNSLSNVEVADFASGVLDTDISTVSANDDTLASAKAIKTYVDDQDANIASDTLTFTNKTFDANGTGNSLSNVEVADFAAAAIVLESEGIASNDNDTSIPTSAAVKNYVDTAITAEDLDFAGDSGTGAVDLDSQSLTIAGTANEIETSASGQTLTVGLPNTVTVTTSLTTPTVKATNLQANDGTTAITITDSTGAVACNQNLTVQGNLIVNGSTTQVNTSQTTIEDQLLELGMVDGSAPSSDLNKDIGVIFNYFTASAKKAAVYWDDSTSRIVVSSDVSELSGVLTNNVGAALEMASLHISGCSGTQEVIKCSSGEVLIENATIDGGTF